MPLSFSSSKFREKPYSVSFGSWRLYECYLVPTRENLEAFIHDEAKSEEENPFIDVFLQQERPSDLLSSSSQGYRFQNPEKPRRIRKLHLQSVGGPLQMMFMHPTKENAENVVVLNETERDFQLLEKLMFRQVIDLREVPYDFVYTADRLMVEFMVHAMLFHVERMAIQNPGDHDDETGHATKIPFLPTGQFLLRYLPLLRSGNVSTRFKRHYAMRLCDYYEWNQDCFWMEREMFYAFENIENRYTGTPKPGDPWQIFAQSDMVEEITWHLINISGHKTDVTKRFITQIQRVEHKMSTHQLTRVLRQMPWSDPWFQKLFEYQSPWSQRAKEAADEFLRLGKSQGFVDVRRQCIEIQCFQSVLSRTWDDGPAQKLVVSPIGPFQYRVHIYFPTQEQWDSVKEISVTIFFFDFERLHEEFVRRYIVRLQVRMIETNCLCDKQEMDAPRYEGTFKASGITSMEEAINNPISVQLPGILTRREWIQTHKKSCSMRFIVAVSFGCLPQSSD